MPISKERIAQATAFQRNCLLNCLSHVVLNNIDQIPKQSLEALRKAFNSYYETNLDFEAFEQAIQIENPVHREIILGPVLRGMLGDPEIVGERIAQANRKANLDKPGQDLEDADIVPLANFFGIYVESYQSEEENRFLLVREYLLSKQAQHSKIRAARKAGLEGLAGLVGLEEDEDYPTLKLWNQTAGHFEYEETDEEAAKEHNESYQDRFRYGVADTGVPSPQGEPDATLIRRKVHDAAEAGAELDLSAVLEAHEVGESNCRSTEIGEDPFSFGFDASGIFGSFSSIGQKIFKAFAAPFINESGSFDSDFQPTSGGWMGIIEGMAHFAMKLVQAFTGLVSVAPELGKAFNPGPEDARSDEPDSEGTSSDLSARFSGMRTDYEAGTRRKSREAHGLSSGAGSRTYAAGFDRVRAPVVVEELDASGRTVSSRTLPSNRRNPKQLN